MCNIVGWAEGTGGIWPREEKDKGRFNCCPKPSKGELHRRQGQTPLKVGQRKDKRQWSQDVAREVLIVGRKFFTRRPSQTLEEISLEHCIVSVHGHIENLQGNLVCLEASPVLSRWWKWRPLETPSKPRSSYVLHYYSRLHLAPEVQPLLTFQKEMKLIFTLNPERNKK